MLFLCNIPSILRVFSLKTSLCSYLLRFLLQEHKLVKDLTTFIGDCLCYFQCIKSSVNIERMFLFTFKWTLVISMLSGNLVCILAIWFIVYFLNYFQRPCNSGVRPTVLEHPGLNVCVSGILQKVTIINS